MKNPFMLWLVLAFVLVDAPFARAAETPAQTSGWLARLSSKSLYNLSSSWENQDGKTLRLETLRGQPVIAAMTYTSCTEMCPLIVHRMTDIEDDLSSPVHPDVRFVLFSLDAARDTPEKLRHFADEHQLDPKHWTLLHGDKKAVQELAAVLGVRYRLKKGGDFDHSNVISLLDADGVVVYQMVGLQDDSEGIEAKARVLLQKDEKDRVAP